ncbi:MAG TPA: hypothetical protein VJ464_29565 [Blastocatellia bacterium]|nr:hypothetical protein [Blastocatellia bacterium]
MSRRFITFLIVLVSACPALFAQQPKAGSTSKAAVPAEIAEVIRRFAAAESENKIARNNYTFTQDFDLLTIGEAGSITGRFKRVSDIVYDDRGNRIEKITYFPSPTLVELQITAEDMHDLAGVQPFALTTEDLPKYQIDYVGKEKVDELNTYVFNVKPKQFVKGERYFEGRMWVDDQDLQVVKVQGQAVPEVGNQKFPHFESYRENIDGKYWFPTYIYADDVLDFKKGPSVHMRMTVRFTNYKKFGGRIKVLDDVDVNDEENKRNNDKSKTPPPNPKKPPAASEEPKLKRPGDRP